MGIEGQLEVKGGPHGETSADSTIYFSDRKFSLSISTRGDNLHISTFRADGLRTYRRFHFYTLTAIFLNFTWNEGITTTF